MTLGILAMGIVAFTCGTAAASACQVHEDFPPEGKKINPLIGSAGVSAVPMAARLPEGRPARIPATSC